MAYDADVLAVALDRAKGFKLTDAETVRLAQGIQDFIREEISYILIVRKHVRGQVNAKNAMIELTTETTTRNHPS